jgi:hypothetical protein
MTKLTSRRLRELLNYDPETGDFTWIATRSGVRSRIAGSKNQKGHIQICIDGRKYSASRLAFFWVKRRWPKHQADHKNLDTSNNRWGNLRDATNAQNCRNQRRPINNTSGFKGVSFHKLTGKYQASIRKDYRRRYLGLFETPQLAFDAYKTAADKLFGKFARYQ